MELKENQIKSFLGTGWGFPPTFNELTSEGTVMVSKEDDIHESLNILMRTNPGERLMKPDYGCGIHKFLFDSITNSKRHLLKEVIRTAIVKYEPRITVNEIIIDDSNNLDGIVNIEIKYTIKSNNNRFNLVFPYYKEEGTDIPNMYHKHVAYSARKE